MNRREFFKGMVGLAAVTVGALAAKTSAGAAPAPRTAPAPRSVPVQHQCSPYEVTAVIDGPGAAHVRNIHIHSDNLDDLNAAWEPMYRAFNRARKPRGVYYGVATASRV